MLSIGKTTVKRVIYKIFPGYYRFRRGNGKARFSVITLTTNGTKSETAHIWQCVSIPLVFLFWFFLIKANFHKYGNAEKKESDQKMKETKKQIFARYGIQFNGKRILTPDGRWIVPFLKKGNSKTGEKVFTFSTLPTTRTYKTAYGEVKGTCPVTCKDCYATLGCYCFPSVVNCLAINTIMVREYMDFVERAIMAQLETLKTVNEIRIFASGDFYISDDRAINSAYVEMWKRIIKAFPDKFFWTYTKTEFVNAFDDLDNANIVKSVINGIGFNFGEVEYLIETFYKLKAMGKDVYICKCGFDESQHCHNCHSCSKHAFVLFLKHSTGYIATDSPLYETLKAIVMAQDDENAKAA